MGSSQRISHVRGKPASRGYHFDIPTCQVTGTTVQGRYLNSSSFVGRPMEQGKNASTIFREDVDELPSASN